MREQGVATKWKVSKTRARGRLKLIGLGAKDASGKMMKCECGAQLDAYEMLREAERPKNVLCCRRDKCGNSACATARIFRLDLVEAGDAPTPIV